MLHTSKQQFRIHYIERCAQEKSIIHSKILLEYFLDSNERFGVDYTNDEHIRNELFIGRFSSHSLINLKQQFRADYIIDKRTTNE